MGNLFDIEQCFLLLVLNSINWILLEHLQPLLCQKLVIFNCFGNQLLLDRWEICQYIFQLVLLDLVQLAIFGCCSCSIPPGATEHFDVSKMLTVLIGRNGKTILSIDLDITFVYKIQSLTQIIVMVNFVASFISDLLEVLDDTPGALVVLKVL
jgi:hypothetical protein